MKHKLIELFFFACNLLGLNLIFRRINASKIRILMYHGVSGERFPSGYWLLVHLPEFEKQMNYLTKNYRTIHGSQLTDDTSLPDCAALITFDDGLLSVFDNALPLLKQRGLPAVCFAVPGLSEREEQIVTTEVFDLIMRTDKTEVDLSEFGLGHLELPPGNDLRDEVGIALGRKLKQMPLPVTKQVVQTLRASLKSAGSETSGPFRLMTKSQLKQFASEPLFEIGGHTSNHVTLSSVEDEQQADEINSCLSKLREWGIEPIPLFCYPSGRFNDATVPILKRASIKAAVATADGLHDRSHDPFEMNRISVGIDTGINEFKARLSGLYYAVMGGSK